MKPKLGKKNREELSYQAKRYVRGDAVQNPDPLLLLYQKCITWNVLPDSGGIYDQSPEVIEAFDIIEHEKLLYERQEVQKQQREARRK